MSEKKEVENKMYIPQQTVVIKNTAAPTYSEIFRGFIGRATSRKFLLALFGFLIPFLNVKLNWGLSENDITKMLGVFVIFIGVEGFSDIQNARSN